jgi:hypothetical protein
MARAPKVYAADLDGVHEWIVAAPNQRAALDALGVHQNLFAQGRASVEHDPAKVEAARDQPGIPLRRTKGSKTAFEPADDDVGGGAWSAALKAAPRAGRRVPKTKAKDGGGQGKPDASAKAAARAPRGPSAAERMTLRGAEAELRAFERGAVKERAALDAEEAELARRRHKLERDQDRRRDRLEEAVDKARAVVER